MATIKNGLLDLSLLEKVGVNKAGKVMLLRKWRPVIAYHMFVKIMLVVFGVRVTLADAYRDLAGQKQAKAELGILAATPGTSDHGMGMAIDLAAPFNARGTKTYDIGNRLLRLLGYTMQPVHVRLGEWWHRSFTGYPSRPTLKAGKVVITTKYRDHVWLWQLILRSELIRVHGNLVTVDSQFGAISRDATKIWQKAHGLPQTGKVDAATWKKTGLA